MHKKIIVCVLMFVTALYAQDPEQLSQEGVQLGRQQRYDESLQKFDESIKIYNLRSARTLHNMGYVYELKGDIQKAIETYEEAVRRNPLQIPTLERLGLLYYKTGVYDKAVAVGEQVIKIDPKNQEVIQWLPDAYKQNLLIQAQKREEKNLMQESVKTQEQLSDEDIKTSEKKSPSLLQATVDLGVRIGYFPQKGGFEIVSDNGIGMNMPLLCSVHVGPYQGWKAAITTGNPFYGALMPDVNAWMSRIEGLFVTGGYYIGCGIMGNYHRSGKIYGDDTHKSDYKIGVLFGYTDGKAAIDVIMYPRLILRDGENSTGRTFDADYFVLQYTYTFDKYFRYYAKLSINEFFFFNHSIPVCIYTGVYDLSIGFEFHRYNDVTGSKQMIFHFSLTERMYFGGINTDDPYGKFGNGQGWFGVNIDKWTKGDPFSGFQSLSHVFEFSLTEYLRHNIFLYQKLIFELSDTSEDHNECIIMAGAGITI